MSEIYTTAYLLSSLKEYAKEVDAGVHDGYEIEVPQGFNNLDPLFLIQRVAVTATFEQQVELTKAMILNKVIKFKFWGESIGEMQLNDINHSFAAFSVFEEHPMALHTLVRLCFMHSLKNSVPPLSVSQRAAMMEALKLRQGQGESKK